MTFYKDTPRLSKAEEDALFVTITDTTSSYTTCHDAKNKLIVHNMRFVDNLIRKQYKGMKQEIKEDIRQEGAIAMYKAIDSFDVSKGLRFSTYARWWMRQGINLYLSDTTKTIRTPVYVTEMAQRISAMKVTMFNKNGVEASDQELSKIFGITETKVSGFQISKFHFITLRIY